MCFRQNADPSHIAKVGRAFLILLATIGIILIAITACVCNQPRTDVEGRKAMSLTDILKCN